MLYLEYRFRRILVTERDVLQRILAEVSVYVLQLRAGVHDLLPILVPCRELCDEHPCRSRTQTLFLVVRSPRLRHLRSDFLQIPDQFRTCLVRIHPRQLRHLEQRFSIRNVIHVERHVAEEACQMPVVKRPEHLRLAKKLVPFVVGKVCTALYARNREVASLHSKVALLPHRRAEARLHRADVQLGVQSTRRTVHHIGHALHGKEILVGVDALERNVAAVHDRLAFRIVAEKVVGSRNR